MAVKNSRPSLRNVDTVYITHSHGIVRVS